VERLDSLGDGPSPSEPVCLQGRHPAVHGDIRSNPVQKPGLQIAALLKLAEVLKPDTFSAFGITHRTRLQTSVNARHFLCRLVD
jgi:hypothetical protein